jgi:hypothetical protein
MDPWSVVKMYDVNKSLWSFGLLCSLTCSYQFQRNLQHPCSGSSENGGGKFLQNVGNHLQDYMASQPRRPQSTMPLSSYMALQHHISVCFYHTCLYKVFLVVTILLHVFPTARNPV